MADKRKKNGQFSSADERRGYQLHQHQEREGRSGNEAEVVETALLSNLLRVYVKEFSIDHPPRLNAEVDGKERAFESLCVGGGLHVRLLNRIYKCESETTALTTADRILTRMGLTHLLANGTIPVIPNPRWSQERWIEYMQDRGCI